MKLTHILVPALILSMFAACDEERRKKKDDPASICNARCECEGCTDEELDACKTNEELELDLAAEVDCDDELEDYLGCAESEGECVSGTYIADACTAELLAYSQCGSAGCPTANDNVCDEPEGSNTCPEGTDPVDCGGTTCATINNGVCDEPEGTDTCPEGSDIYDCSTTCPYTNNDQCDEPEGTNLCAEGTDVADCSGESCPYTNNGQCDEPEGSGLCADGTDALDCSGPQTCDSAGTCGDFQSGCVACAAESGCAAEYSACVNSPECLDYNQCAGACADEACVDMCGAQFPNGSTQYNAMIYCVICTECPVSCDGPGSGC